MAKKTKSKGSKKGGKGSKSKGKKGGKPKPSKKTPKVKPVKDKGTKHPDSKPIKQIEGLNMRVRFSETDLIGTKKLAIALTRVKGIGRNIAKAIVDVSGLDPNKLAGHLTDEEIAKLEDIALNPTKHGICEYMVNRQKDPETGETIHRLSSELMFTKKTDIDAMRKIQCYKGVRHQLGLPVRGQRTRSSFRTGARVGVVKKKKK